MPPSDKHKSKQIAPWDDRTLTPSKLAAFYRLVGGNYDSLFLDSPDSSIAFIYKSLGCLHSLQPNKDAFATPSIPALTPHGYVRWQTVQLLLGPEEHVPYLQAAVKRLDLKNHGQGGPFPRHLPAEAFPRHADPDMCSWHETVEEKLRLEAEPTLTPRLSKHLSRPSDVASLTTDSSIDDPSVVDAGDYFQPVPRRPNSRSHGTTPAVSPGTRGHFHNLKVDSSPQPTAHSHERRRSVPDRES